MKIEILYGEICNLYADIENVNYLKKCIPDASFINTNINEKPYFVDHNDINLIYLGSMTENMQELVIKNLEDYKDRIEELIEKDIIFLVTGNAIEIFGKYIEEKNIKIDALGMFDFYTKRDLNNRYNSLFLGTFNDIEIVGFKHQFTKLYGNNEDNYFIKVKRGIGFNDNSLNEGIRKNNFFGTQVLGPFLLINPLFTKYLFKLLNIDNELLFENEAIAAYKRRLKEFEELNDKNIKF